MSATNPLRELLFKQAQLYRGVTREQFNVDRPADALFPRDHVAAAIAAQNDAEKAETFAPMSREAVARDVARVPVPQLTKRQAGGL